jgi:hypothetical protein
MRDHDPGPLRVQLAEDGVLHLRGLDGWPDPICPECGGAIRLVLDLMSWSVGHDHRLVHARCVWRPEVFAEQEQLSYAGLAAEDRPGPCPPREAEG